jgi:hypothetical protein
MDTAEKKLGRPPTYIEIHAALQVLYPYWGFKFVNWGYCVAFVQQMYLEDSFYADKNFVHFTTNLHGSDKQGYENFSTRFRRMFPGYHLDSTMHIRANKETTTLNLQELIKLFRSKDEKLWE